MFSARGELHRYLCSSRFPPPSMEKLYFFVSHPFSVVFVLAASAKADTRERKDDIFFSRVQRVETCQRSLVTMSTFFSHAAGLSTAFTHLWHLSILVISMLAINTPVGLVGKITRK